MSTTNDTFRDRLTTVDAEGKKMKVYPKKPKGRYHFARKIVGYSLLAFLFIAPIIKVNGNQFLLFDIINRKFILFGSIFWPQDFFIIGLLFLTSLVFLILFTVVYGRIFCGWVCPQTIFMEMVFRKIEYLIEGDYTKQRALDRAPWTTQKILKKSLKHTVFLSISFLIGNTFLSYIIGLDELKVIITDSPTEHFGGLSLMILFSLVFYGVFAYFREQVCTIACPYGRLQGVLLDESSVVVAYDNVRGEPRGKLRKNVERTEGDCIDCKQCVHVCPTSIDIRNGTQLECINCTACIDECDSIMDRIGKPRGLIRFDSLKGIETGSKFKYTLRTKIYSVILFAMVVAIGTLLTTRTAFDATILRTPGMLYKELEAGKITNLYNIKVINKTHDELPIKLKLLNPKGSIKVVGGDLVVPSEKYVEGVIMIEIDKNELTKMSSDIEIGVFNDKDEMVLSVDTRFLGPAK